jgi:hypothetical protein
VTLVGRSLADRYDILALIGDLGTSASVVSGTR